MAERARAVWKALGDLRLTIGCLLALMVLVTACTLAQARIGIQRAVDVYMRSMLVWWDTGVVSIPVFPGGGLLGFLLLVNLASAQFLRLEFSRRKLGLWVVHLGLIALFAGEFVTGLFQADSQMALEHGASKRHVDSIRELELAIVDHGPADHDEVTAFSERVLKSRASLPKSGLPFAARVERYDDGRDDGDDETRFNRAGVALSFAGAAPERIALRAGESAALEASGRRFSVALRPRRTYLPFALTLQKFTRENHPGTEIPRLFSSRLTLSDPARGPDREVLVSMNDPLRYGGLAFFQASFERDGEVSVLQVVDNPGWTIPYIACLLVALGLAWHFGQRLRVRKAA